MIGFNVLPFLFDQLFCQWFIFSNYEHCRIVGMAGIGESLLLVSFCGLCTFLTGISLSAIATNGAMKVDNVCNLLFFFFLGQCLQSTCYFARFACLFLPLGWWLCMSMKAKTTSYSKYINWSCLRGAGVISGMSVLTNYPQVLFYILLIGFNMLFCVSQEKIG